MGLYDTKSLLEKTRIKLNCLGPIRACLILAKMVEKYPRDQNARFGGIVKSGLFEGLLSLLGLH